MYKTLFVNDCCMYLYVNYAVAIPYTCRPTICKKTRKLSINRYYTYYQFVTYDYNKLSIVDKLMKQKTACNCVQVNSKTKQLFSYY